MIVDRFPHSQFDPILRVGFLALYYTRQSVGAGILSDKDWRDKSFSPEILDFKEGQEEHIRKFVPEFAKLSRHALQTLGHSEGYLVPIPSSLAQTDPHFKRTPRLKSESRNRDDRNTVFCGLLTAMDSNLKLFDVLQRVESKVPKENWSAERQAQSMRLNAINVQSQFAGAFILVDDVFTSGETMAGAEVVLRRTFPLATIIKLAIGKTTSAEHFQPLFA